MKVTEELIVKFFRQECTPVEQLAVGKYFDEHPQELDKYLNEGDWANFNAGAKLHPALTEQMRDAINERIGKDVPQKAIRFKIVGVAASFLVVFGVAVALFLNKSTPVAPLATNAVKPAATLYDTVTNRNEHSVRVSLKDGSVVILSAKSEIRYRHLFVEKNRDIYLKGEAVFKVAKDKTRPFTVYAGGLSTTALGTRFKVSALRLTNKTIVELYEGKVVVKEYYNGNKNSRYLKPGQMLVLNIKNDVLSISAVDKAGAGSAANLAGSTVVLNGKIMFQNQSLQLVMAALQKYYHIQISADSSALNNRYFTGDADLKADKPEEVLKTIAILNKLTLTKQGATFKLSR